MLRVVWTSRQGGCRCHRAVSLIRKMSYPTGAGAPEQPEAEAPDAEALEAADDRLAVPGPPVEATTPPDDVFVPLSRFAPPVPSMKTLPLPEYTSA